MAKNRALLKNETVVKRLWCSDMELETDTLIDCGELPVSLGDSDSGGKICRDGREALSEAEALRARDAQLLETMAAVMEEVCESDLALTQ